MKLHKWKAEKEEICCIYHYGPVFVTVKSTHESKKKFMMFVYILLK